MNNVLLLLVAVGLSCLMAAQAVSPSGVLAGLGALTSAVSRRRYHGASHGRGHGHGYRAPSRRWRLRYGRSVEAAAEEDDLILSTVAQLDPNSCIPRMLCVLQAKEESNRSPKENLFVEIFASNTMNPSPHNAAFVYAKDVAIKTRDASACKKLFPECPFPDVEMSQLLELAWSCDCNSGGKE
ncbi:uncharacterized protein LOC122268131 [Penaeus japonicus]|uniref:uncharacterized protein LOC122268131 n=1 Tax=Penaeus japonicus TaxID=27405 RepID=UPI001C710E2D|nr:uncharacterized protein LOC122268131 [Penaeus japonicus]XP_042894337.1 uncharacterized protein LOC122268131 [Penaeus japonicus]XP_042894338.1 uncharacterized protein LOC122268131 [Penaeus japonicus]XP_042894339.1 uncharacterized protein LOC122268131 [Penaeus japonicus]